MVDLPGAGRSGKFLTPNKGSGFLVVSLILPAHLLGSVRGAIEQMTYPDAWELHGDETPEECSGEMEDALQSLNSG
jgi:hypothetical protein